MKLVGSPLAVSRTIYDPDEGDVPPEAMSEMTRAIFDQRRRFDDLLQPEDLRAAANKRMQRLHAIHSLHGIGLVEVLDMTPSELKTFATLTDPAAAASNGLLFSLAGGEAATIALAVGRGLVCATDDNDALKALATLAPGHKYERIRKLLQRAAKEGHVTRETANRIHDDMRRAGFWDKTPPCP